MNLYIMNLITSGKSCSYCLSVKGKAEKAERQLETMTCLKEVAFNVEQEIELGKINKDQYDFVRYFLQEAFIACNFCDGKTAQIDVMVQKEFVVPFMSQRSMVLRRQIKEDIDSRKEIKIVQLRK